MHQGLNAWKVIGIALAVFIAACCAIALMLFLLAFWWGSRFESPTFSYPNVGSVQRARSLGWMPDFLPASAKNIKEKRNGENGTSILAFEFSPGDFGSFSNRLVSVPSDRFREIRPHRVYKQESWFPKTILKGQLHKLVADGFSIYQSEIAGKTRKRWFVAVNQKDGLCYMWHRHVQE